MSVSVVALFVETRELCLIGTNLHYGTTPAEDGRRLRRVPHKDVLEAVSKARFSGGIRSLSAEYEFDLFQDRTADGSSSSRLASPVAAAKDYRYVYVKRLDGSVEYMDPVALRWRAIEDILVDDPKKRVERALESSEMHGVMRILGYGAEEGTAVLEGPIGEDLEELLLGALTSFPPTR